VQQWINLVPKANDISLKELLYHYVVEICEAISTNDANAEFIISLIKDLWIRTLYPKVSKAISEVSVIQLKFPEQVGYTFCPPTLHVIFNNI